MRHGHVVHAVAGLALIAAASIASGQNAPAAVGTLAIQTTPAEATAIVDGEVRGTTPLVLPGLAAGPHRVVIKRAGFLENSADVEVMAGRTVTLDRALTPESAAPRTGTGRASPPTQNAPAPPRESPPPRQSPPPQRQTPVVTRSGSGGGGKKWALVAVAGGAAAGAAAAAAQANKNVAPIPGTIAISPSGTGMLGQTNFSIRSTGVSDKNNDPLTFNWTFGDGSTGSGQNTTHIYGRTGTFSVGLAIGDGKLSVNAPNATVTVGPNLAGTWAGGSILMPDTRGFINVLCPVTLSVGQSGTSLAAALTWTGACFGSVSFGAGSSPAALTHPAPVTFANSSAFSFNSVPNLFISLTGTTNAAGTTMSATITLSRPSTGGVSTSSTSFSKSG
jgi:hypothetical protein